MGTSLQKIPFLLLALITNLLFFSKTWKLVEEGINSDTLTKGVGYYTHSEIEKADDFSGHIDGIYTIEQWQ